MKVHLTPVQWLICIIAAIGFAFDIYELLMLPLIVGDALSELANIERGSPEFSRWVGILFFVPAIFGGIFGLLGGYLTDRFGRRRVLVWSILLYAGSVVAAAFSTPPLSRIDMAAYVYAQGDFLLPHDDRVAGRRVAYSLHLTRGLREEDGGALELFSSRENIAGSVVKRIVPEFNSLVLFRVSPRSWHQVAEVIGPVQLVPGRPSRRLVQRAADRADPLPLGTQQARQLKWIPGQRGGLSRG